MKAKVVVPVLGADSVCAKANMRETAMRPPECQGLGV